MADYGETSSDNLNANSPGSEGNDKDSDYAAVDHHVDVRNNGIGQYKTITSLYLIYNKKQMSIQAHENTNRHINYDG